MGKCLKISQKYRWPGAYPGGHTPRGPSESLICPPPPQKVEECCPHTSAKYDAFVKHVILTLKTWHEYLFICSNLSAHSTNNNKFTEVVIYFVTFLLIRAKMNGTSYKQGPIQDCSPGCCNLRLLNGGVWGDVLPSEAEKNVFLKFNSRDLVHPFWQQFTNNPLFFYDKALTIISSHLSCFDAFARTIINLLPLKRRKGVWGDVPSQKLK